MKAENEIAFPYVIPADASDDAVHDLGHRAAEEALSFIDFFIDDVVNRSGRTVHRDGAAQDVVPLDEDEASLIYHTFFHHLLHAMDASHSAFCDDETDDEQLVPEGNPAHADVLVPRESRAPRDNADAELDAALIWGWAQGYARSFTSSTESAIYIEWLQMLSRCYNPQDPGFPYEGARGIKVADEWNPAQGGSFDRFYSDMLPMWSEK